MQKLRACSPPEAPSFWVSTSTSRKWADQLQRNRSTASAQKLPDVDRLLRALGGIMTTRMCHFSLPEICTARPSAQDIIAENASAIVNPFPYFEVS
jgi:hypothetical protein